MYVFNTNMVHFTVCLVIQKSGITGDKRSGKVEPIVHIVHSMLSYVCPLSTVDRINSYTLGLYL